MQRHPHLRKIGYDFHGDDFEAYTPKLQSRVSQSVLDEEPAPGTPESAPQGG